MDKPQMLGGLPGALSMPTPSLQPVRIVPLSPAGAVPVHKVPLRRSVRLVAQDNGFGLSRDRDILDQTLKKAGWNVLSDAGPVELQIHLEAPAAHTLGDARRNILIPNPEWWTADSTSLLKLSGVQVWAKTADAERIFRGLGAEVTLIGWRSLDRLDPAVPRRRAFLHVAGQSPHKGTELLLRTWRPEWPPLTIISARPIIDAPVHVTVYRRLAEEDLRQLQNAHRFHIYPARYEGFGHAEWEGLSCGAVVFATGGPPFDEHPEAFRLLPADPVSSAEASVPWHEVRAPSIAEAARWAREAPDSEIVACGARARMGWEQAVTAFEVRIGAALAPSARRLTLHSPLQRCGVAEYGRQLDRSLAQVGSPMQAATLQDPGPVEDLGSGDAVLVHFEPGIVPQGLAERLAAVRARSGRVVFCCHYFDEAAAAQFDGAADVFVVHRRYPFERPKMRRLALGCPVYGPAESRQAVRTRLGLPSEAVILTTLGLLSTWKRIPDIVRELLCRRQPGDRVFLQILTPSIGEASQAEAARLHQLLDGQRDVLFSTEFRPEIDLLDRAYASDLGVLFHAQDTGSVSAATKQFVSAQTPLVITGSSHASDLEGGIVRIEGFDPADLAEAALALARDEGQRAALRREAAQEYARLNMNRIAARYAEILGEGEGL